MIPNKFLFQQELKNLNILLVKTNVVSCVKNFITIYTFFRRDFSIKNPLHPFLDNRF